MNDQIGEIETLLKHRKANILGHEHLMKAAVILPLIEQDGETHLLFEVRSLHLKSQPGEICFPGGKVDESDQNEEDTAIRELCEELGLTRNHVELIAALDFLVTPHTMIFPFVGKIENPETIKPNPAEVEEIFSVPLHFFMNTKPQRFDVAHTIQPGESFPFDWIPNGKNYKWRTGKTPEYFYQYNNYIIWGLTARIIHHFIDLITKQDSL